MKRNPAILSTLVLSALSALAPAKIVAVLDSRVQGFFQTPLGLISDPLGQPGVVGPPAGGAAVAGANGAQWVPFSPAPRTYAGSMILGNQRFVTQTAIIGGFVPNRAASVVAPFVRIPSTSYLLRNRLTVGAALVQLNYSIDYSVDRGGLRGDNVRAFYPFRGGNPNGGTSRFQGDLNYWFLPAGGGAAVFLGTVGVDSGVDATVGNFFRNLNAVAAIAGVAPVAAKDAPRDGIIGTLRVTGMIRWDTTA